MFLIRQPRLPFVLWCWDKLLTVMIKGEGRRREEQVGQISLHGPSTCGPSYLHRNCGEVKANIPSYVRKWHLNGLCGQAKGSGSKVAEAYGIFRTSLQATQLISEARHTTWRLLRSGNKGWETCRLSENLVRSTWWSRSFSNGDHFLHLPLLLLCQAHHKVTLMGVWRMVFPLCQRPVVKMGQPHGKLKEPCVFQGLCATHCCSHCTYQLISPPQGPQRQEFSCYKSRSDVTLHCNSTCSELQLCTAWTW